MRSVQEILAHMVRHQNAGYKIIFFMKLPHTIHSRFKRYGVIFTIIREVTKEEWIANFPLHSGQKLEKEIPRVLDGGHKHFYEVMTD